jgi:uncharacterized membrane protein
MRGHQLRGRDCNAEGTGIVASDTLRLTEEVAVKTFNCHRELGIVAVLLLAGCQREAAAPPSVPEAVADAIGAGATAQTPVAESGLTIKRGAVVLTADARTLRLCGENEDLWLAGQGDDSLEETYTRLAGDPGTPLYVEVRGERTATPGGTSIPTDYKQAFLLEELLYAGLPGEGAGCETATPAFSVLARGNEPFWAIEVATDKMVLRQPDPAIPLEFPADESQDAEGSVTYRAAAGGHQLELTVARAACTDSMSGAYFAYTAEAELDGRKLQGCARLGE